MTYEEALAAIASLQNRGWKLGLERMEEFVRRAGLSDAMGGSGGPQYIHVAGTNGKGSVTAFLQSMLVESGYRTGAFFSPYVFDPRERVQFGRELIGKQELADLVERLAPIGESLSDTEYGGISEFELKTGIGFQFWKEKRCEWVALEVGLGGRLDSTNVVTPRASVIVSIGLDHVGILGDTEALIAREKAGIVKPNVPLILGRVSAEASEAILGIAEQRGAPVYRFGREILLDGTLVQSPWGSAQLRPSMYGEVQLHNAALAVAAMGAAGATKDQCSLERGVERASAPGRFQRLLWRGREVILDGAHNGPAAEVLAGALRAYLDGRGCVVVTGMVRGHEPEALYAPLQEFLERVVASPIDFYRAVPPGELAAALSREGRAVETAESVRAALDRADALARPGEAIVVTGSFYLVGEALHVLESG